MKFVVIDGCPVPRGMAPAVRTLKHAVPGAVLVSCYRGDKATSLLKRLGKSTQRMLWNGWSRRLRGYNPANPPGFSTHELHSDGIAYRGPRGRALFRQWQCGMDWDDAHVGALVAAARRHGWELFQPYPTDPREHHHLNFRHRPKVTNGR